MRGYRGTTETEGPKVDPALKALRDEIDRLQEHNASLQRTVQVLEMKERQEAGERASRGDLSGIPMHLLNEWELPEEEKLRRKLKEVETSRNVWERYCTQALDFIMANGFERDHLPMTLKATWDGIVEERAKDDEDAAVSEESETSEEIVGTQTDASDDAPPTLSVRDISNLPDWADVTDLPD
jgi:hypothetical protein